jgi:hypothetical protein
MENLIIKSRISKRYLILLSVMLLSCRHENKEQLFLFLPNVQTVVSYDSLVKNNFIVQKKMNETYLIELGKDAIYFKSFDNTAHIHLSGSYSLNIPDPVLDTVTSIDISDSGVVEIKQLEHTSTLKLRDDWIKY